MSIYSFVSATPYHTKATQWLTLAHSISIGNKKFLSKSLRKAVLTLLKLARDGLDKMRWYPHRVDDLTQQVLPRLASIEPTESFLSTSTGPSYKCRDLLARVRTTTLQCVVRRLTEAHAYLF